MKTTLKLLSLLVALIGFNDFAFGQNPEIKYEPKNDDIIIDFPNTLDKETGIQSYKIEVRTPDGRLRRERVVQTIPLGRDSLGRPVRKDHNGHGGFKVVQKITNYDDDGNSYTYDKVTKHIVYNSAGTHNLTTATVKTYASSSNSGNTGNSNSNSNSNGNSTNSNRSSGNRGSKKGNDDGPKPLQWTYSVAAKFGLTGADVNLEPGFSVGGALEFNMAGECPGELGGRKKRPPHPFLITAGYSLQSNHAFDPRYGGGQSDDIYSLGYGLFGFTSGYYRPGIMAQIGGGLVMYHSGKGYGTADDPYKAPNGDVSWIIGGRIGFQSFLFPLANDAEMQIVVTASCWYAGMEVDGLNKTIVTYRPEANVLETSMLYDVQVGLQYIFPPGSGISSKGKISSTDFHDRFMGNDLKVVSAEIPAVELATTTPDVVPSHEPVYNAIISMPTTLSDDVSLHYEFGDAAPVNDYHFTIELL